ncbi:MAG TPA: uroporphyrinogen decarboxylase family protein [Chloroflexota bacterium]|nr:uroporphyrinogen decarboxylase family protein [Chloroflexota bacterium]
MTPKERVFAALRHREPDRVPTGEIGVDWTIVERALGRESFYRAKWKELTALWDGRRDEVVASYKRDTVDIARAFEWDAVPVTLAPRRQREYRWPKILAPYTWEDAGGRVHQYAPESGGNPICIKYGDLTWEQLEARERQPLPAPGEDELEIVRHVVAELGETHFIFARGADGCFPYGAIGMEEALMRMVLDPEFMHRLTDLETRRAIAVNDAFLDAGCDAVLAAVDVCDNRGPIMGPGLFEEFVLPSIEAMAAACHRKGKLFIKHNDGNNWPILDRLVAAGIDGYQAIQPAIGMDMRRLKQTYGGRLCLWGGVDVDTLVGGTPEDVRRQVAYAIEHAAPGGGLLLCSGNSIMATVQYENYLAMLAALRDYGTYPIRVPAEALA